MAANFERRSAMMVFSSFSSGAAWFLSFMVAD
jgi:hypothetical protein